MVGVILSLSLLFNSHTHTHGGRKVGRLGEGREERGGGRENGHNGTDGRTCRTHRGHRIQPTEEKKGGYVCIKIVEYEYEYKHEYIGMDMNMNMI